MMEPDICSSSGGSSDPVRSVSLLPADASAGLRVRAVVLQSQRSWDGGPALRGSVRRFVGLLSEALPDESTILHFRHILEKHESVEIKGYLESRGLLREGTIVDATIITKNRAPRP